MSVVFSILATAVCMLLIGYPMFKPEKNPAIKNSKSNKRDLSSDKEILMSSLGEIEFDYRMKKISDEDYLELKGNYSAAVAEILKEQQTGSALNTGKKVKGKKGVYDLNEINQEIEAELQALD